MHICTFEHLHICSLQVYIDTVVMLLACKLKSFVLLVLTYAFFAYEMTGKQTLYPQHDDSQLASTQHHLPQPSTILGPINQL